MSSHLIRSDLIPIVTGYVLVMVVLAAGLLAARRRIRTGRPLTRYTGRLDRGWPAFSYHLLADALGGYLLLAAVVVLYYYLVARVASNFLDSEFSGSALLLAIALPVYLAASWLSVFRQGRRTGRGRRPGAAAPDGTENRPDGDGPPQA
jgi:ABC-type Fe3+ transport system permease subunit